MRQAGIPFEEVKVRFDSFDADSQFKKTIGALNPVAKVPVLVDERPGDVGHARHLPSTWPSRFPDKQLWPRDRGAGPGAQRLRRNALGLQKPCAAFAA
jgi:glutathione S-transferase